MQLIINLSGRAGDTVNVNLAHILLIKENGFEGHPHAVTLTMTAPVGEVNIVETLAEVKTKISHALRMES